MVTSTCKLNRQAHLTWKYSIRRIRERGGLDAEHGAVRACRPGTAQSAGAFRRPVHVARRGSRRCASDPAGRAGSTRDAARSREKIFKDATCELRSVNKRAVSLWAFPCFSRPPTLTSQDPFVLSFSSGAVKIGRRQASDMCPRRRAVSWTSSSVRRSSCCGMSLRTSLGSEDIAGTKV